MQKIIVTIIFVTVMWIVLVSLSKDALPTSSLYNVKRLNENFTLITKFLPRDKALYYRTLLEHRLTELQSLQKNSKQHHLILPAALRYSTIAGEYTQLIKNNNLIEEAKIARQKFKDHTDILNKLVVTYPRENVGDRGDVFIVDDVNYLKIYEQELP